MKKKLAECLSNDLDEHSVKFYREPLPRWHLGASIIGDECWRKLWYGYRWVYHKKALGRMYRLWNRGHKEEFRFVEWLRGMGHTVEELDPATGKQWRISDCGGHFGGSCDGTIILNPEKYPGLPKMLLEFKTSGSKYFDTLKRKGVVLDKAQHFAQMNSYGKRFNLHYALYMNVNKDTDEIYFEIVELNWNEADHMTIKAGKIISSPVPPPRISENSAFMLCKNCDFRGQCHEGKPYDINCRSCKNAYPVEGGEWACALVNQTIPREFVPKGCASWSPAI